jgi:hypothetical protein
MHYVCIENNQINSILNYEPNVPNTVRVVVITTEDYDKIKTGNYYFNVATDAVEPNTASMVEARQAEVNLLASKKYLADTDWMVLRHMREKTLGMPTTLSDSELVELETKRAAAAALITR